MSHQSEHVIKWWIRGAFFKPRDTIGPGNMYPWRCLFTKVFVHSFPQLWKILSAAGVPFHYMHLFTSLSFFSMPFSFRCKIFLPWFSRKATGIFTSLLRPCFCFLLCWFATSFQYLSTCSRSKSKSTNMIFFPRYSRHGLSQRTNHFVLTKKSLRHRHEMLNTRPLYAAFFFLIQWPPTVWSQHILYVSCPFSKLEKW